MILTKDKEGDLCLIGDTSLGWYSDHKVIKILKDLPIELKRLKTTIKLDDILAKQQEMFDRVQEELKLRRKMIKILIDLGGKE